MRALWCLLCLSQTILIAIWMQSNLTDGASVSTAVDAEWENFKQDFNKAYKNEEDENNRFDPQNLGL